MPDSHSRSTCPDALRPASAASSAAGRGAPVTACPLVRVLRSSSLLPLQYDLGVSHGESLGQEISLGREAASPHRPTAPPTAPARPRAPTPPPAPAPASPPAAPSRP